MPSPQNLCQITTALTAVFSRRRDSERNPGDTTCSAYADQVLDYAISLRIGSRL
jgi:hypothetical protein